MDDSVKSQRALEVFLDNSAAYCDINGLQRNWESFFRDEMAGMTPESLRMEFKYGFALAVTGQAVSAKEYERRTGWDFDTEGEYRDHLRRLWSLFYGDESPEAVLG